MRARSISLLTGTIQMAEVDDIGGMDTLVTMQSCEISRGSQGQKVYNFTDHSKVFAKVVEVTDENIGNSNLAADATLQITVYKIPDLTTRWRVIVREKPYAISAIDQISRTSPVCNLTLNSISEPQ